MTLERNKWKTQSALPSLLTMPRTKGSYFSPWGIFLSFYSRPHSRDHLSFLLLTLQHNVVQAGFHNQTYRRTCWYTSVVTIPADPCAEPGSAQSCFQSGASCASSFSAVVVKIVAMCNRTSFSSVHASAVMGVSVWNSSYLIYLFPAS